jgi:uncharacterized protein (TIGR02246 family)
MRFLLLAAVAVAPMLAQTSADEAPIRALVAKYVNARDHPDAKSIEGLFTADADQLVSSGEWRRGRDAVVQGTMAASANEGKRTITVESVRFLDAGTAIADGRYEVTGTAGGPPRKMWTSITCVRTPSGWRIAAIRNMLPAAPAGR